MALNRRHFSATLASLASARSCIGLQKLTRRRPCSGKPGTTPATMIAASGSRRTSSNGRMNSVPPGEHYSTEDLVDVDPRVLQHLIDALRAALPIRVQERAKCGFVRQNRGRDERAHLININVMARHHERSRAPPPQAVIPHEDELKGTQDAYRKPCWRKSRKLELDAEHAEYGLKQWYFDPRENAIFHEHQLAYDEPYRMREEERARQTALAGEEATAAGAADHPEEAEATGEVPSSPRVTGLADEEDSSPEPSPAAAGADP